MAACTWNFYLGSETGLFKGVNTKKIVFENFNSTSELNKENEITTMCWGNSTEDQILLGQKNQVVKVFDCNQSMFIKQLDMTNKEGALCGLLCHNNHILTALDSGSVNLWSINEKNEPTEVKSFDAGKNLYRVRQNRVKTHIIATGGEENELKIWDLERTETPIFKAKNVRNDFLNLRVPVWVTDMQFVPASEKIITCTRHHQIRLYDPSSRQKRPVIDMEFEKYPLLSLSLGHREYQVVVGSSRGRMALIDLRKKAIVHAFKGFSGSIRCVQCHPTLPLVASCGLDRFLRVHDLNKHLLVNKIYLKSRLNCLLMRTDFDTSREDKAELPALKSKVSQINEALNDEDEEIWKKMKVVTETSISRKRDLVNSSISSKRKKQKLKKSSTR